MATAGTLRFTNANSDYFEIAIPPLPYSVYLDFPFEPVELDSGAFAIYDYGTTYDKRRCSFSLELDATDANEFNAFLKTAGATYGRSATLVLTMGAQTGFYPFGPDKGNAGPFTVALFVREQEGQGPTPFKLFKYRCDMMNTSSYPAYTLPTQVYNGGFTFGTVTQCRMPTNWYAPNVKYRYAGTQTEDATIDYVDRGTGGDFYRTDIAMSQNQSKAAAIVAYMTATARATTFTVETPAGHYPFGRDKGDGVFTVRLAQPILEMSHSRNDEWQLPMTLEYVSGPA